MNYEVVKCDVDTLNDFMFESGALPVPRAYEIKPNLKRLDKLDYTEIHITDRHFWDDPEISRNPDFKKTFPPHAMNYTWGQNKISETALGKPVYIYNKIAPAIHKKYSEEELDKILKDAKEIVIEKQKTDVFSNPYADRVFRDVKKAIVYGVATDYCVKDAVMGMLERDIEVYLVTDAIRGIAENTTREELERMRSCGAIPVTTDDVVNRRMKFL